MHGLGNDYVYLDEREVAVGEPAHWARRLSDRHRGIGADGLIILRRDPRYPCRMEMYNADGSRAEMCGNGIRCVARLAWERGYAADPGFEIGTDSGPRRVQVLLDGGRVRAVRVAMGIPEFDAVDAAIDAGERTFRGTILTLGNPHFVVELDTPPADFPVATYGPIIERDARFPKRTNVEFVRPSRSDRLEFRVWERGAGETQACGTGATAAVAALQRRGRVARKVIVELLGGELEIDIAPDGEASMTGPAEESFRGVFPLSVVGDARA